MPDVKPFWETAHPYHAPESNYYASFDQLYGDQEEFDTVESFLEYVADQDVDYNHLYRWDYVAPDPDDYDEEDEDEIPAPHIVFCYLQQRRGNFNWIKLNSPKPEDEPQLRAYLEERWKDVQRLWAPLS